MTVLPVMLMPENYDTWLGPTTAPQELRALLRPYDASLMEARDYPTGHADRLR
jgi:putative SOS response-associated peptidase YedK